AAGGAARDHVGASVALAGDTAILGAPLDDVGTFVDQGSAYIFVRAGTTWTQQAQLIAADGVPNEEFGRSVAISGNTALVGVPLFDFNISVGNVGKVYVFIRSGTTWTQQTVLITPSAGVSALFGESVALSGDIAVGGSPGAGTGGTADVYGRWGA
ncbi:MAG: FG-GAP repeat protein, partial [Phycisphaerae bacterium]